MIVPMVMMIVVMGVTHLSTPGIGSIQWS
jgi:hypothetical protein